MSGVRSFILSLVPALALPTMALANPKPPLENVQQAHQKVVQIKSHLNRVIRAVGGDESLVQGSSKS